MITVPALGVTSSRGVNNGDAGVGWVAEIVTNQPGGLIRVGHRSVTNSKSTGLLLRLGAVGLLSGMVRDPQQSGGKFG